MTELQAQGHSRGIIYEPYQRQFKLCVHEEANVDGRDERYEFRCDANLYCCGRVCCLTEETLLFLGIPLWLWLVFLLLALMLLAIPFCWWMLSKKRHQKKAEKPMRKMAAAPVSSKIEGYRPSPQPAKSVIVQRVPSSPKPHPSKFRPTPSEEFLLQKPEAEHPIERVIAPSRQSMNTVVSCPETPNPQRAMRAYIKPGVDKVPAYNPI